MPRELPVIKACLPSRGISPSSYERRPNGIALTLRRAEERFIPQFTRAASFKRLLGRRPTGLQRVPIQNPNREQKADDQEKENVAHGDTTESIAFRRVQVRAKEPIGPKDSPPRLLRPAMSPACSLVPSREETHDYQDHNYTVKDAI